MGEEASHFSMCDSGSRTPINSTLSSSASNWSAEDAVVKVSGSMLGDKKPMQSDRVRLGDFVDLQSEGLQSFGCRHAQGRCLYPCRFHFTSQHLDGKFPC